MRLVRVGARGVVAATVKVNDELLGLDVTPRTRLLNHMEKWANDGPAYLKPTKFKPNVGRFPDGSGKKVLMGEFKDVPNGIRVYGSETYINGMRFFLCSGIDANKKRQRQDNDIVARSAQRFAEASDDWKA